MRRRPNKGSDSPPSDRHLSKVGRTELAPRHGTRRQGRNKTDWPPQQGCGIADRCTLFQRHPKAPDSTSQSQTGRPCPPGRTTAGNLSSGERGGGLTEFSYLQTTSRFLLPFPLGPTALASCTHITPEVSGKRGQQNKSRTGLLAAYGAVVIMTRPWRDDMRRTALSLSRRLRRVKSSEPEARILEG